MVSCMCIPVLIRALEREREAAKHRNQTAWKKEPGKS
jgi:hypothetical protein